MTLRLEGQIIGDWIAELNGVCERILTAGRKVTLDLGDVSLIDRSGLALLASLSQRGVALVRCSPFQEAQLRSASSPQPYPTHYPRMDRLQTLPGASSELALRVDPDRWVDDHGDCLYRYALIRVRKQEVAEDLVQETLLAAMRQADKFSGRSSERTWLCGILKNKIRDYFRRLGRETNFADLEFFSDESSDRFDGEHYWIHERGPANWKPEGEEAVKRAEFWEAVQACLDRLPPRVAQVFIMREMDDIPSKEVCEMLNISQANLWVMLHRARMALRQDLEKTFFESNGGTKL